MKRAQRMIFIISVGCFSLLAQAGLTKDTGQWTSAPWQAEDMISLDKDILVVDFGPNGLWSYDGTWVNLSRFDPLRMVSWGGSGLAVDFGPHGLWVYDQSKWEKIAL